VDNAVDLLIGNNRKKDLVEILENYMNGVMQEGVIDIHHASEYEEMQITSTTEHTRAYIKIQDGCNQFCTYCMIPYARGHVRCRAKESIMEEIKGLTTAGYKEFVLTGIHISSYGMKELLFLMQEIDMIEGVERIRLGSLEPRIITEDFAEGLSVLTHLCPHFHLSLQSGCDSVLKRMNRHYTAKEYLVGVQLLRQYFDNPAITTDVIVGFPGETEREFEVTRSFVETVRFYEMHIFKYSKRQGTKAAVMPDQVPENIKTYRSNVLQAIEQRDSKAFRASYIGKKEQVLFEEKKTIAGKEYWIGHTKEYVKVACVAQDKMLENQLITEKIKGFLQEDILII